MRRTIIATAISLSLVSVAGVAAADTLILRDGTRVPGTALGIVAHVITFEDAYGVTRRYNTAQIESIEFTTARPAPTSLSGHRSLQPLPRGTELLVRTVDDIDSETAVVGQTFSAIFESGAGADSTGDGIPAGSLAELVIREISSGGATGSPEMVLDVQTITVRGRRYLVSTTDLLEQSGTGIGKNKRTAETVGGGAVLGTLIGAIAGGGKGAAIGSIVGAAGGAGVEVLSKGREVRVPAETVLRFRLDKPVTLQAER